MSDRTESRAKFPALVAVVLVVLFVLLPVLYVLSTGPVLALEANGYLISGTYGAVYFPLTALRNQSDSVNQAIFWYEASWQ